MLLETPAGDQPTGTPAAEVPTSIVDAVSTLDKLRRKVLTLPPDERARLAGIQSAASSQQASAARRWLRQIGNSRHRVHLRPVR
jgi:hypothetical protein